MGDGSTRPARLAAPGSARARGNRMSPAFIACLPVPMASGAGTGGTSDAGAPAPASAEPVETRIAGSAVADAPPAAGGVGGVRPASTEADAAGLGAGPAAGRRRSPRPTDNAGADDLPDRRGHRRIVPACGLPPDAPGHGEIAGTLDDSRAGPVAGSGARRGARPDRLEVTAAADPVRGTMSRYGLGDGGEDGWHRFRRGGGPGCGSRYREWGAHPEWRGVAAADGLSPGERVLDRTAGRGPSMAADMPAGRGAIRIGRRGRRPRPGRGRVLRPGAPGGRRHGPPRCRPRRRKLRGGRPGMDQAGESARCPLRARPCPISPVRRFVPTGRFDPVTVRASPPLPAGPHLPPRARPPPPAPGKGGRPR